VSSADLSNDGIPTSYVLLGMHNPVCLCKLGRVINAKAIFIGAVWEDSSGYPDADRNFLDRLKK